MKDPIELIKDERLKQFVKGFDQTHDDGHTLGELAEAAGCYLCVASSQVRGGTADEWPVEVFDGLGDSMLQWPFEDAAYHPAEFAIQNLAKAGALIVAEMERLQRTVTNPDWNKKKGGR
ncbi:MAG: hypothetical protein U1G08_02525 [Verrucomicrobiota bacterium]